MSDAPPPTPGPPPQPRTVARLIPGAVSPARLAALRTGAVLARAEAAVVTLTGPGAVTAAQGLLTNDVEQPGDGAFVYGALLTPKGMIVVDAWVARLGGSMSFAVAAEGRERALAIFTRSVPPRLARLADRTEELGGVSYTKGCYTGQETVSRLHFRGHTNRYLRGLLFDAEPPATPADGWSSVTHLDRDVGRVTSLAWVPESGVAGGGRWIGLALIRREVGSGVMVRAAGRDARVVDLPFATPFVGPA